MEYESSGRSFGRSFGQGACARNIRVNHNRPGPIETPFRQGAECSPEKMASMSIAQQRVTLARMGPVEEVARDGAVPGFWKTRNTEGWRNLVGWRRSEI